MSRFVYAEPFTNPAERLVVKPVHGGFSVFVQHDRQTDGSCLPDRPYKAKNNPVFDAEEYAYEFIEGIHEAFEADYSDYLEENRFEILQMEQYEAWRNER